MLLEDYSLLNNKSRIYLNNDIIMLDISLEILNNSFIEKKNLLLIILDWYENDEYLMFNFKVLDLIKSILNLFENLFISSHF
jgi:hypothetical protein